MPLPKKRGDGIDVCTYPDGQLIIQLVSYGWLDIDERKRCRSDGRVERPIHRIASVQAKRRGETESERHIRYAIRSARSQVRSHIGIARWWKRDASSKVSPTVYPGWACELNGTANQGCSADHLDSSHLSQSCRVVMDGRWIIGLCRKGIALPSRRGALRLQSNGLSRSL